MHHVIGESYQIFEEQVITNFTQVLPEKKIAGNSGAFMRPAVKTKPKTLHIVKNTITNKHMEKKTFNRIKANQTQQYIKTIIHDQV